MSDAASDYRTGLPGDLVDPAEAAAYLNAALEDGDRQVFLLALRDIMDARGIAQVARDAQLNRENLYRILSPRGNPQFSTLTALLRGVGLRLAIEVEEPNSASSATVALAEGPVTYGKAESGLQRVLREIPVLDQHELQQVQQAVRERLASKEMVQKRRAFHRALRASGLVRKIKVRPAGSGPRRLAQVQGPPVSQTIIEERR